MWIDTKAFWQSKTFWLNLLTLLVAVLTAILGLDFVKEYPQIVTGIVSIVSVLNMVLRFLTTEPITVNGERVLRKK